MDGRDIGTCVLPKAQVKIYLTASAGATRASRRYEELAAKGISGDLGEIEQDIIARDKRDMERETSPLKAGEDGAVLVDSSELTIDEVVAKLRGIYEQARKES